MRAHFSNNVNQQLKGDWVVHQGVGIERTEVLPRADLVVHCTQVRPDRVAMLYSTNGKGKGATWSQINKRKEQEKKTQSQTMSQIYQRLSLNNSCFRTPCSSLVY